jgi:hypothetical protein
MGTPPVQDLKAPLRMNMIYHDPVTISDIELAEKIFGQDIGSLKGKTVRRKPIPVVEDYIEIPKELVAAQHAVKLCIDLINVNGLVFLTTIPKHLYYRTTQFITNKTPEDYGRVIKNIFSRCTKKEDFKSVVYNVTLSLMRYKSSEQTSNQISHSISAIQTKMSLKLRGAMD